LSPRSQDPQGYLGKAIRKLREECGLSQGALSRRTGIDKSEISKIENGHFNPSWGRVARIASGLNISVEDIAIEEARIEGRTGWPPRIGDPSAIEVGVRFGQNVRRLRQSAGMTQRRLARKCGISARAVGFVERGRSLPMLDTVVKLAASLETPPEELFDGLPSWLPDEDGAGKFLMSDLLEPA
jgi:putative transcriptional regulator